MDPKALRTMAKVLVQGRVIDSHSGTDKDREFCDTVEGRDYLDPGECVIEYEGALFIIKVMQGPFHHRP